MAVVPALSIVTHFGGARRHVVRHLLPGAIMRHLRFAAVLATLTLGACLEPDPVPESNYGVIGLSTVPSSTDTILSPEAIFYRTGLLGLPTSIVTSR